jgi:hypothetical protein
MTSPSAPYELHPALLPERTLLPEGTPEGTEEQVAQTRQCARCGGVSTHYLTCPALRLPQGYRVSDPDRRPR